MLLQGCSKTAAIGWQRSISQNQNFLAKITKKADFQKIKYNKSCMKLNGNICYAKRMAISNLSTRKSGEHELQIERLLQTYLTNTQPSIT